MPITRYILFILQRHKQKQKTLFDFFFFFLFRNHFQRLEWDLFFIWSIYRLIVFSLFNSFKLFFILNNRKLVDLKWTLSLGDRFGWRVALIGNSTLQYLAVATLSANYIQIFNRMISFLLNFSLNQSCNNFIEFLFLLIFVLFVRELVLMKVICSF